MSPQATSRAARCVIIGGGQAAAQTAFSLRQAGYDGEVWVFGEEYCLPYQRPPLSKGYLAGTASAADLGLRPPSIYTKLGIEVVLGVRVEAIDRAPRSILVAGRVVRYDTLVLATGATPRRLALPGADADHVVTLRTVDDAEILRSRLRSGAQLVIVGGGYLGLEVAAVAVRGGARVTVLEAAPTLLARVAGPPIAAFFENVHRAEGVDIVTGARVTSLAPAVCCADGTTYRPDVVVVAVGAEPRTELARGAGLTCDGGIVIDACGRTDDPAIFATGDCANHPCRHAGRRVRLESVGNAVEQSRAVAATIAGSETPYTAIPWFWSDQYEHKLQTVGIAAGYDRFVVSGDPEDRSFSVSYLAGGRVVAVDAVNAPREFARARALLAARASRTAPVVKKLTIT